MVLTEAVRCGCSRAKKGDSLVVVVVVALALAVVSAVAVALAFDLPGSLPQRRMDRGKTRRAAHMDVRRSRQGQDAPSANPRCIRGPGARSAEGARQGALSFGYFSLREQRKVTRPQGRKPLLLLRVCVSNEKSRRSGFSRDLHGKACSRLKPLLQKNVEAGAKLSPGGELLFFACAKKSNQKKAHPASRPPR
ncbi:hypothetical protein [Xanthomonas sacchari]|uniref:hypothetical protein n=1 Tax=Xanthomonas sacchari TaxID=56458 RepID=UPI00224F42EF|nr:hypothetical protein [Xanthomonas sacchari]